MLAPFLSHEYELPLCGEGIPEIVSEILVFALLFLQGGKHFTGIHTKLMPNFHKLVTL
jgi:hypothetical protein